MSKVVRSLLIYTTILLCLGEAGAQNVVRIELVLMESGTLCLDVVRGSMLGIYKLVPWRKARLGVVDIRLFWTNGSTLLCRSTARQVRCQ